MDILNLFSIWMTENSTLSDNSIYKYTRAVNTISNEMLNLNIIQNSLFSMNIVDLDFAIYNILNDTNFKNKNSKGNNMYSNALKQFRYFVLDNFEHSEIETVLVKNIIESNLLTTEKEILVTARIGQGKYRKELLKKYENTCIVTGINKPSLLIASHIKPWALCNNEEKIDVENGLLLSPNMDKLFDNGLITFTKKGKMRVSSFISDENKAKLHITLGIKVNLKPTNTLLQYLEYHEDVLFVK